ncbi:benzil reductase ((S)-benzoin forming) [Alkalihalobacillus xiaoxiensis]|uniref:Benzil reductase ((S)-benzoin forming) n=1 Tax=Shouchella xiaoxiensis TaxID=766895 RepID=A0ABS2ST23_9BACI|nr:SDR family NAD(P)-dependent oxidoreductase [Shouchella xiaoxiensis]MBM7837432.1 benzil reductase ((S)-benzoin forming) [Shouchella xiaoxiensis]
MKIAIIIGASKGLGATLTSQLLEQNYTVTGFSRTKPEEAILSQPTFTYVEFDASNSLSAASSFRNALKNLSFEKTSEIHFVYNAAILDPVGAIGTLVEEAIAAHIQVNLTAPLLLANAFLNVTQSLAINNKKMTFVTSGAATNALPGWACYSSTKAGLNRLVQALAKEQKQQEFPFQVCGFNPGIMDTAMQESIRQLDKLAFPEVERFQAFHREGQLQTTKAVATALMNCLTTSNFPDGQIVSVNDFTN